MNNVERKPEVWLRGEIPGVPALLQPVAHALLQATEDARVVVQDFPDDMLWVKPAGAASAGFHIQHMAGVVDRLFSYARGEALTEAQHAAMNAEGVESEIPAIVLLRRFAAQVDAAITQLRGIDEQTLTESRPVGRKALPSTTMGLLFHAAEHTQRHLGQLIVTARIVRGLPRHIWTS